MLKQSPFEVGEVLQLQRAVNEFPDEDRRYWLLVLARY